MPRPKPASMKDPRVEHLIEFAKQLGFEVPPPPPKSEVKPPVLWGMVKVEMSDGSQKPVLIPAEKDITSMLMGPAMVPAAAEGINVSAMAAMVYREFYLAQAGSPQDPSVRMLVLQAMMCEFLSRKLLADAREGDPESRRLRQMASLKLIAEHRQSILAQKEYQTPPVAPEVTHIDQQNIATEQEVLYSAAESGQSPERCPSLEADNQLSPPDQETSPEKACQVACESLN